MFPKKTNFPIVWRPTEHEPPSSANNKTTLPLRFNRNPRSCHVFDIMIILFSPHGKKSPHCETKTRVSLWHPSTFDQNIINFFVISELSKRFRILSLVTGRVIKKRRDLLIHLRNNLVWYGVEFWFINVNFVRSHTVGTGIKIIIQSLLTTRSTYLLLFLLLLFFVII